MIVSLQLCQEVKCENSFTVGRFSLTKERVSLCSPFVWPALTITIKKEKGIL